MQWLWEVGGVTHGLPQCQCQGPAKDLPGGFWKAGQCSKGCAHLGRKVPEARALCFVSAQERNVGRVGETVLHTKYTWQEPGNTQRRLRWRTLTQAMRREIQRSFSSVKTKQNKILTSRYTPRRNPAPKPKAEIALGENQQSLSLFSGSSIKKESDLSKSEVSLFTAEGLCCSQDWIS